MNIAIIGLGYVGVTTMLNLAEKGFNVVGVDTNKNMIQLLKNKKIPFHEPGLQSLLNNNIERLEFHHNVKDISKNISIFFVCVGTPSNNSKNLDLKQLDNAIASLDNYNQKSKSHIHLAVRSTLPLGTMSKLNIKLNSHKNKYILSYHPEFLREGSALQDIKYPEVIVVGYEDISVKKTYKLLYKEQLNKLYFVSMKESEIIKSVNNAWHALKVCFTNEVSSLCKNNNVDPNKINEMFLGDRKLNISEAYLRPGFPFGGSCLEKDSDYLRTLSKDSKLNLPLILNINKSNEEHYKQILREILNYKPKCITIISLAFKANTNDLRNSIKLKLASDLISNNVKVKLYDKIVSRMITSKKTTMHDLLKSTSVHF